MRRRTASKLQLGLALLLIGVMTPGLPELVETVEHLIHDGHLPFSAEHAALAELEVHDREGDSERACTPLSHQCECHVSSPALLVLPEFPPPPFVGNGIPAHLRETPQSCEDAPPVPPPTA